MKTFNFIVSQNDATMKIAFELNEDKAVNVGVIVGTAVNSFNEKIQLSKQLGAKIFQLNKPVQFTINADGINVDSRLLDAGVLGVRKEFAATLRAGASLKGQQNFAKKVWAMTVLLLQQLEVKHISELTGNPVKEIMLPAIEEKIEETTENSEETKAVVVKTRGLKAVKKEEANA